MWNVEWFDHSGRNMLEVTNRTLLQKLMKKNNKTNRKTMKYQQGHYMERTLYRAKKSNSGSFEQLTNEQVDKTEWGRRQKRAKFLGFIREEARLLKAECTISTATWQYFFLKCYNMIEWFLPWRWRHIIHYTSSSRLLG